MKTKIKLLVKRFIRLFTVTHCHEVHYHGNITPEDAKHMDKMFAHMDEMFKDMEKLFNKEGDNNEKD